MKSEMIIEKLRIVFFWVTFGSIQNYCQALRFSNSQNILALGFSSSGLLEHESFSTQTLELSCFLKTLEETIFYNELKTEFSFLFELKDICTSNFLHIITLFCLPL